ncbi:MAG: hypothetical protein ACOYXM_03705 [Actinomycetota bacterium]
MAEVTTAGEQTRIDRVTWRTTARALVPAARAMPIGTLCGALALAAAPTAGALARGGTSYSGALIAAAVVGSSTAAFAVDDAAGETLAASPTSLARRRALRLIAIALLLSATWAVLIFVAAQRGTVTGDDLALRAAEAAAVSGTALAVAGIAHAYLLPAAGSMGAVAGALSVLVVSSLAVRFRELPALVTVENHGRWWLVSLAGWCFAFWTWRDPARPRRL